MSKELRLGGHLKMSEGLSYVIATARGMCYNEIQVTSAKDRDYFPWELSEDAIAQFRKMTYEMKLTVHAPYVINPCESVPQRKGFYKKSLKDNLVLAEALGAKRVVLHPGHKKELTEIQAFKNLIEFLEHIWRDDFPMELLLEVDAGSKNGSAIGSLDFIREVIRTLTATNVKMCLDTEHLYARGINMWDAEIRKEILNEYGDVINLVHLNVPDREVLLGSHLDRHNTAFEDRHDLDSAAMIEDLSRWPMILERRSLYVQQRDNLYVRKLLGVPLEKQHA